MTLSWRTPKLTALGGHPEARIVLAGAVRELVVVDAGQSARVLEVAGAQ